MKQQLLKNRSVSEVAVDAIQFVKEHSNLVLKPLLVFAVPLLLFVNLVPMLLFQGAISGGNMVNVVLYSSLVFFLAIVAYFLVYLIGLSALRQVYENRQDEDSLSFVREFLGRFGGAYVVVAILSGLAVILGFIVLFFPGVYIAVAIYTCGAVLVFEQERSTDAIGRAFEVSKGFWWYSFFAILLLVVVILLIDLVLSLPLIALAFFLGIDDPEMFLTVADSGANYWIYIVASALKETLSGMVQVLSGVGAGMLYFSLREKKEGSSVMQELDDLEDESGGTGDFDEPRNV